MAIDSSVYRRLTDELIAKNPKEAKLLPGDLFSDAFSNNPTALMSYIVNEIVNGQLPSPAIISNNTLFSRAAISLLALSGDDSLKLTEGNAEQRAAMEMLSLLCFSISSKSAGLLTAGSSPDHACAVLCIEAALHAKLCPSGFENTAKACAHLHYVAARKNLFRATAEEAICCAGLFAAAWHCAQRTEGVADTTPSWEGRAMRKRFLLADEDAATVPVEVIRGIDPAVIIAIPEHPEKVPHALKSLTYANSAGAHITSGNNPIITQIHEPPIAIDRPKFTGNKYELSCTTADGISFSWTVVIQIYCGAVYRIDAFTAEREITIDSLKLTLENSDPLIMTDIDEWKAGASPGCFSLCSFDATPVNVDVAEGMTVVDFPAFQIGAGKSKEFITAWMFSEKSERIPRTGFLGVFDR